MYYYTKSTNSMSFLLIVTKTKTRTFFEIQTKSKVILKK